MGNSKYGNTIGGWAFLIGVLLAIIIGAGWIKASNGWTIGFLVIGLIIGLLNIADEETTPFLMSGVILIIASSLGNDSLGSIGWVSGILNSLLAIFVPATIVVAIRNVFSLARR